MDSRHWQVHLVAVHQAEEGGPGQISTYGDSGPRDLQHLGGEDGRDLAEDGAARLRTLDHPGEGAPQSRGWDSAAPIAGLHLPHLQGGLPRYARRADKDPVGVGQRGCKWAEQERRQLSGEKDCPEPLEVWGVVDHASQLWSGALQEGIRKVAHSGDDAQPRDRRAAVQADRRTSDAGRIARRQGLRGEARASGLGRGHGVCVHAL